MIMSFCKYSEGDVYMIPASDGIRCFCGCSSSLFTTIEDAIDHIRNHRKAGDIAPYDRVIDLLQHTTIEMVDGKAIYGTIG